MTRWAWTKHFYVFKLVRRQNKRKHAFSLLRHTVCSRPNHSWWNKPRCTHTLHITHWLDASWNVFPELLFDGGKEEEKSSGNMFCSWFNPKIGSSSSSWVWLRSDHIQITPGFVCTDTVSSRRSWYTSLVHFIGAHVNVAAPLRCAPKVTKGGKQSLAQFSRTQGVWMNLCFYLKITLCKCSADPTDPVNTNLWILKLGRL